MTETARSAAWPSGKDAQQGPPPGPYRAVSRNVLLSLAAARADLRTANRRVARGEERVRRWEALIADPMQGTRWRPGEVLRKREKARQFTEEWATRKSEIAAVIARLRNKSRVRYSESSVYRRKLREAAKSEL